jgi:DNA-binding CsgD family transcriptional regulator
MSAPTLLGDELGRLRPDPARVVRGAVVAPAGYGKSTALAALAEAHRAIGRQVRVFDLGCAPADDAVLLVDDAHLLGQDAVERLASLMGAGGVGVLLAARPWPRPAGLTSLVDSLDVIRLAAWPAGRVGARLADHGLGDRSGLAEFVHAQTGGVPGLVDRIAGALATTSTLAGPVRHELPEAAVADMIDRLTALGDAERDLLVAADLAGDTGTGPHPDLLTDLLAGDRQAVADATDAIAAHGLLDGAGRLLPLVRLALRSAVPADRRAAVRQGLASAQLTRGAAWAEQVALTGDLDTALRTTDQVLGAPDNGGGAEAARVAGAALAHRGQLARGAELLTWAGTELAIAFAVPALIGTGRFDAARAMLAGPAPTGPPILLPTAANLVATGVHISVTGSPTEALTHLVNAAALLETADSDTLLPDTPAAIAALVAVGVGEFAVAESVLERAELAGTGGIPFALRHPLLRAWVALTRGNLTTARERLHAASAIAPPGSAPTPRDWMFAIAVEVGLARRSGDLTGLGHAWGRACDAVLRHPVDLYTVAPLGEFLVAAARLGQADRMGDHLAAVRAVLAGCANPPLWTAGLVWHELQAAVVAQDAEATSAKADELAALAGQHRFHDVLAAAARCWLTVLIGQVDPDETEAAAMGLHTAGLAWDAGRLAGQAALRTTNRSATVNLLEFARALTSAPTHTHTDAVAVAASVTGAEPKSLLSDREQEVARLVLDGLTYREVGEALFISPKTVEHHIARIRQRLGSTSRRDLLARLRTLLD